MSNPSGVDRNLRRTRDILWQAPEVNLVALFSPEHGFAAAAPDAAKVASMADPQTGLPIYSLYGETYRPTEAMLQNVDVIVCDLQDVGVRFYTYVWTVSYILDAAGEYGVEVVILDRPNPLGGNTIAGPLIDEPYLSFVGRFPIPISHGLTLGELAQMVNAIWNPQPAKLTVIPCAGWSRSMTWDDTGLPWIPPSPAMPHDSTVQQYPGACLIEGTQLSEGRGTALPFEVVGAPWINAVQLADHLNAQQWPGVVFRPHTFMPTDSKWRGAMCHGVQVHITDMAVWRPIAVWLGVIREICLLYSDQFAWLPPQSTGVEAGEFHHFDRLVGSDTVRHQIDAGVALAT
ncbi:MAG: DUF1343 domain-containing protein, partial [Anaerolineae bacterium]|nr:DUF1343 domain-containing protein [Anaerolineae bacterium]